MYKLTASISGLVVCTLVSVFGAGNPVLGQSEKPLGEPTADQALVYFIWPEKDKIKWSLYLDDNLLWRTKGNSYGFAHIDPGLHWIWGNGGIEVELVPGETYYLLALNGLSTLSSEEGRQYIEDVKRYEPLPTPGVVATKSQRPKKWFPKMLEDLREQGRIEIEAAPPPPKPAKTDGLIRVPQHASFELELAQTVTTVKNITGDRVWFRVTEDAVVDGQIWLLAGTPVEGTVALAQGPGRAGVGARFEVVIPAATTVDGGKVPMISRFTSFGRPRGLKGASYFGLFGLPFAAATRGRHAYEMAGSRWPAWTRHEVWVRPPSGPVTEPGPSASSVRACEARPTRPELSIFPESPDWPAESIPSKPRNPTEIKILIVLQDEMQSVELVSVNDWRLPEPIEPVSLVPHEKGWVATFDGWDLVRHLPPEETALVGLRGALADGTVAACGASFSLSHDVGGKK